MPGSAVRALALILGGLLLAPAAWAQPAALNEALTLERLRLATDRSGILSVEGGTTAGHLSWEAGLWMGWASHPLVVLRLSDDARLGSLVGNRVGGSVMGVVGLFGRAQLGFELPVVAFQERRLGADVAVGELPPLAVGGLGNLRLVPKVRLLESARHGVDLAVLASFGLPTGRDTGFIGEGGVAFQPEVALSRAFGAWRVAGNLGVALRRTHTLLNLTVQSELTGQVGAAYRLGSREGGGVPLEVELALAGSAAARRPLAVRNENALEVRGMLAYDVSGPVRLFFGGGRGLSRGWGTPEWRAFGGVRLMSWAPPARPAAEPLLAPAVALAPVAPVAPVAPLDSDGDGLEDAVDRCPTEAETLNAHEDGDGCPDTLPLVVELDRDSDGLTDARDCCPLQPEDADGFEDTDGCPDLDDDKDGVADAKDACVREAGPVENLGCPDKDRDGDKRVDRLDECPDLAGPPANKGCPRGRVVRLVGDRIEFKGSVYFATNKDIIQKRSYGLLDSVATVILAHPEIERIRVEGHTDDQGRLEHNMRLSQRRAQAIQRYLVLRGISEGRLESQGFGPTRPKADNRTRQGRAENRRVEFHVVSTPAPAAAQSGN